MNVLDAVVARDRCIGCGVCAGICPEDALAVRVGDDGDLRAAPGPNPCAPTCSACLRCCPFESGVHDARPLNERLFGGLPMEHPDLGRHLGCVAGHRADVALRAASASGGLATWCLERLLAEGEVARVCVVRWAGVREGRPLFEFFAATSVEELRGAAGSAYTPVEIGGLVRRILESAEGTWAVVGVPCLSAALRRTRALRGKVRYVLGLACGMYQNGFYTELLAARSGVRREELAGVEYRRKGEGRAAADFGFVARSREAPGADVRYRGLPAFLGRAGFFRQNACNYCMDVFAEAADACFMDAWLPEYERDGRGTSLVVLRAEPLARLFGEGARRGELHIAPIGADAVARSQQGQIRRKRALIRLRLGAPPPAGGRWPLLDRVDWRLQRRVQERSKAAWAAVGRPRGEAAFWRAMRGVRLELGALSLALRVRDRARRLLHRAGPGPGVVRP